MSAENQSIADVLKNALRDAQDLVRTEVTLAKTELRQEMSRYTGGAAAYAGAAVAALLAVGFLLTTIAWAISEMFGWPVWTGFGIVTLLMMVTAGVLAYMGRSKMAVERHMPKTMDTMKENMEWMRARTS